MYISTTNEKVLQINRYFQEKNPNAKQETCKICNTVTATARKNMARRRGPTTGVIYLI
jgi:hypothetical protein